MREKLIELTDKADTRCRNTVCELCEYHEEGIMCTTYMIADCLIDSGVIIPIRCGECAFSTEFKDNGLFEDPANILNCPFHGYVNKTDYCNYAERKEK